MADQFSELDNYNSDRFSELDSYDPSQNEPPEEAGALRSYVGIPIEKGIADIGGAVGYGLEAAGLGKAGRALQDSSQRVQDKLTARQSQSAQEDAKKTLIDDNGDYGGYNLGTLAQDVFASAPGTVAMGVAGAPLAKVGTIAAKTLGLGEKLAKVAGTGALGKGLAAGIDTALGSSVGFGASEGIYSGASNAAQVQNEIRNADINEMSKHPVFAETYHNETDPALDPVARLHQTRDILARKAGDDVFADTAIKTGLISMATGGGVFGMIRGNAAKSATGAATGGVLQNAAKGFALEGLAQEAPQSALEQRTMNQAKKDYLDPNQDLNQGVLNAGLQGGIAGGVMGLFGGAGGNANVTHQETDKKPGDNLDLSAEEPTSTPLGLPAPNKQLEFNRGQKPPADTIVFDDGSQIGAHEFYQDRLAEHGDEAQAKRETYLALNGKPKPVIGIPELVFTADGTSLNKSDLINGFKANGASEQDALDYIKKITATPVKQRTETNLDPYRFLQERGSKEARQGISPNEAIDPEALAERLAIQGENAAPDQPYDGSVPYNPQTQQQIADGWEQADFLNEAKPAEAKSKRDTEARKRLLQTRQDNAQATNERPQGNVTTGISNDRPAVSATNGGSAAQFADAPTMPSGSATDAARANQSPEKLSSNAPEFAPTHELSDGTPAMHISDNAYADAQGNEYQDDYATAIKPNASPAPSAAQIDAAAHQAATSPLNNTPQPTQAMKEAGNYQKGHVSLHGLDIAIENPQGSNRSGTDKGGKPWSVTMAHHYGYIKRSKGADNEHVDVYIGPRPESKKAFIVNQNHPHNGKFDEHKIMLGFTSMAAARKGYLDNYEQGWQGIGSIAQVPVSKLKEMIDSGQIKKPITDETTQPQNIATDQATVSSQAQGGVNEAAATQKNSPSQLDAGADTSGNVAQAGAGAERSDVSNASEKEEIRPSDDSVVKDTLTAKINNLVQSINESFPSEEIASSWSGISHSTSRHAKSEKEDLIKTIKAFHDEALPLAKTDEQKTALFNALSRFKDDYMRETLKVARVRSGTYSSFVAGRSNFNRKQADKRGSSYDKANEAFSKWYNSAKGSVKKAVLDSRSQEQLNAEKATKEAKQKNKEDQLMKAITSYLNFKPGDNAKFGSYPIKRVTVDKQGYPSAVIVDATDLTDNKFDIAKTLLNGDKDKLREIVDKIRSAEQSSNDQENTQPTETKALPDNSESKLNKAADQSSNGQANAYHPAIKSFADDLVEGGGVSYTYDENGKINGRTPSVNPDWFKDGAFVVLNKKGQQYSKAPSVKEIKQAVADYESGKKITDKQHRILTTLSDIATAEEEFANQGFSGEQLDYARDLEAGIISGAIDADELHDADSPEQFDTLLSKAQILTGKSALDALDAFFGESTNGTDRQAENGSVDDTQEAAPEGLSSYTEAELAAREREQKQRDQQATADELKAKQKEQADKEIDTVADEMFGNIGTNDIFGGNPMENLGKAEEVKPVEDNKTLLESHKDLNDRLDNADISAEELKAAFEKLVADKDAVYAELNKLTKDGLAKKYIRGYVRNDATKADFVRDAYQGMLADFKIADGMISYGMGKDGFLNAIRKFVDDTTDADIKDYAEKLAKAKEERAARKAEVLAGMDNPETADDFGRIMRVRFDEKRAAGMGHNEAFNEARMEFTPEQREKFDSLVAEKTRGERQARADQQREVSATVQTTTGDIIETKHTKTREDLFVVKTADRVDRDIYNQWNATAKRLGGWYSSYRAAGAVPGFQFKTKDNAEAFLQYLGGDVEQAKQAIQERRDAYADDKSQTAVERLNEMADRLEDRGTDSLSQDRKANTHRRAGMAARAEAAAQADIALAKTMRNIARAIDDGKAQFLDRVRQKTQVEMLQGFVHTAQYDKLRKLYPNYGDYEKHEGEAPNKETADYAQFPSYTAYRSDLASLGRSLLETDGTKKLGQRLMKVADDVSDVYLKFAKEHLHSTSYKDKNGMPLAHKSKPELEDAISRQGFKGKAIVLQVKRGENVVILSPSEAIKRGIWKGDNDKRITLSNDFGAELVEKMGKAARRGSKVSIPWQLENAYDKQKRLAALGIATPAELRAALREFIGLREAPKEADKIKSMERAMIGRANDGLDFFPTPAGIADEMIEAADIQEGMSVLEPSAGMGHIAEQIREAGFESDVVELSNSRKELLEAKGFNVVGRDFMDLKPTQEPKWRYDEYSEFSRRLAKTTTRAELEKEMDKYDTQRDGLSKSHLKAIEATTSMQSQSQRRAQTGNSVRGNYENYQARVDALEIYDNYPEQTKEGGSLPVVGYDRIIMNPPFGDRRDALHVQHAYDLLNPGGRLVAIMGEGVFFGSDKKATAFREWLEERGATDEKLAEGTFNDPSLPVNTGVNARMLVIDKPESGDTRYSKSTPVTGSTVEDVKSWLPKRVNHLVEAGKLKVVQSTDDAPATAHTFDAGGVEGFYDPSKDELWLIADNLNADNIQSVLAHELLHRAELKDPQVKTAIDRFEAKLNNSFKLAAKGHGSVIEKSAYARVMASGTPIKDQAEEYRAYMVSEYQKNPESLTGMVKKAIADLVAAIRAFLVRNGLDMGFIKSLTPADLAALSKYGAKVTDLGYTQNRGDNYETQNQSNRNTGRTGRGTGPENSRDSYREGNAYPSRATTGATEKDSGGLLRGEYRRATGLNPDTAYTLGGQIQRFVHRSESAFNRFDDSKRASNTGTPFSRLGHFLSTDDGLSSDRYGQHKNEFFIQATPDEVLEITPEEMELYAGFPIKQIDSIRDSLINAGIKVVAIPKVDTYIVLESDNAYPAESRSGDNIRLSKDTWSGSAYDYVDNGGNQTGLTNEKLEGLVAQYANVDGKPSREKLKEAVGQYRRVEALYFNKDGSPKPGAMKAPNGKPTNLNKVQWIQTRTPNFKRWFGDSKVVDENGDPRPMFHGTAADFDKFNGFVNWFSESPTFAGEYSEMRDYNKGSGGNVMPSFIKSERQFDADKIKARGDTIAAFVTEMADQARNNGVQFDNNHAKSLLDVIKSSAREEESGPHYAPYQFWMETNSSFGTKGSEAIAQLFDMFGFDSIKFTEMGEPTIGVLSAEQVKSATANTGTFNPESSDIRFSKSTNTDSAIVAEAKRKAGLGPKKTLTQAITDILSQGINGNIQALQQRWEELKPQLEQGIFDKFYGIKLAEKEILGDVAHSLSGYISARLSTGSSSTMQALLLHGAPKWMDGIIQKKDGSKGFAEILQPVKDDLENFTAWMVGKRADRLYQEGKENNFNRAEIDALLGLKQGHYQGVADDIAAMNSDVLDLAQDAGLVDPESRKLFESNDYIPFYRLIEGKKSGPGKKGGLTHQTSGIKMLKGGDNPMSDPLGNMMQNWAHLIDASMKNDALNKTLNNLDGSHFVESIPRVEFKQALIPKEQLKKLMLESGLPKQVVDLMPTDLTSGIAKMWSLQAPTDPDVVRVMRGGKSEYYRVNDAMLLTSLSAVNQIPFGGIFKPMRYMKHLLTAAVTADPTFMARNFIRDSMHSWTIAEEKGFKLGLDSLHGAVKSFKEEGGYIDMMFAGASFQGGYGNYNNPDAARDSMDAALRRKGIKDVQGFKDSILDTPKKYWEMYRSVGDAIENANREAILENAKRSGAEKAKYLFEAKDLMDFSMQGSFTLIRAMSDMLPFFNARLIGLYRLAKAGKTAEARKMILAKGLSIAMFSLALLALNADNDDYEELEDWDKDQYWHFFFGDQHYRIPKPFELGLVFGTVPERSARMLLGQDSLGKYAERMGHGASDTLAFNPIPQLFKPFIELYSNKDMFTGRPIEGMADEGKLPSARYNEYTSETMRALSSALPEALGASPKRLEHLMHGYLGALGMYALGASDMMVRELSDMPELPESRIDRLPVIKAFYQEKPTLHTKYGTEFYDMLSEVNRIHKTINAYKKEGNFDKARELMTDNADKLRSRKQLETANKQLSRLRQQVDVIYRSSMSASDKRRKIDDLTQKANAVTRLAVERSHPHFN